MNANVNAYNVGEEFMRILDEKLELEESQPVTSADTLVAELLVRKFANITCKYVVLDDEENYEITGMVDPDLSYVDDEGRIAEKIYEDGQWVPIATKEKFLRMWQQNPNRSFKTIQSKYPCLKHRNYKKRWEEQVASGGTTYEKLVELDKYVYGKFEEAREEFKVVHDIDIRRLAVQYAVLIPKFPFKASPIWLLNFQRRHGIGSRKIQRVISKREVVEAEKLEENCDAYRKRIKEEAKKFDGDLVWCTDQVGVEYEMLGGRTISFKGERVTFGFGFSPKNRATHSYTVQPTISLSGKVIGVFYVCLQELKGKLGPNVEKTVLPAPNITLTCSSSGKLTKSHVGYFLDMVIKPQAKKDFLLTYDSFSGQLDQNLYTSRFGINGVPACTTVVVPEKCTFQVQALDTGFNRQLKYFLRECYQYAALHESDETECRLTDRNQVLKLISSAHFILSAPKFKGMICNAWVTAGLLEKNQHEVVNVRDGCIRCVGKKCELSNCLENPFIRCPWCNKSLCLQHFRHDYHVMECAQSPGLELGTYESRSNALVLDPELEEYERALPDAEILLDRAEAQLNVIAGSSHQAVEKSNDSLECSNEQPSTSSKTAETPRTRQTRTNQDSAKTAKTVEQQKTSGKPSGGRKK